MQLFRPSSSSSSSFFVHNLSHPSSRLTFRLCRHPCLPPFFPLALLCHDPSSSLRAAEGRVPEKMNVAKRDAKSTKEPGLQISLVELGLLGNAPDLRQNCAGFALVLRRTFCTGVQKRAENAISTRFRRDFDAISTRFAGEGAAKLR